MEEGWTVQVDEKDEGLTTQAAKDDRDLDSGFDQGANGRFDEEDGGRATRPDEMGTDTESIVSDIEGVVKLTDDINKAM